MEAEVPRPIVASKEFNKKATLKDWVQSYQQGDLLSSLKQHWRSYVPYVYAGNHEASKEERLSDKLLFRPMEEFICNGDPEEVFRGLKEKDKPSQICGHGFKTGEPTYSCRDCATDPTCVLCINCFQKSSHKQHRYRMSTSGGGGYCDCGDLEAWKTEPFCAEHKPRMEGDDDFNPMDVLPTELSDRASILFLSTLKFCVEILTWEECIQLPEGLEISEEETDNVYHCMLFNDEVHTYDQVIQTLQKAIECTQKEAVDFATIVDREGRSSVLIGLNENCTKSKEIIEKSTSRHGNKPLKVNVMHSSVVAHQNFALKLLQWLEVIISKSDGLRRLFCLLSMQKQENGDDGQSLMERLLLADTRLWKSARVQSHQLLMAGVLMDQECKQRFAIIFTTHYKELMGDFCLDDHEHDVSVTSLTVQIFTVPSLYYAKLMQAFINDDHKRKDSITYKSVQLFTIPYLARMLITKYNLLEVLLRAYLEPCQARKNAYGKLSFERNERNPAFKRAWYILYDLKYALICKPSPKEWDKELRTNFLNGLKALLELLSSMQGMDCVQRQTGHHLEFEPEWEGAFNLQLKLEVNLVLFAEWCASDKTVLLNAYQVTLEALNNCHSITDTPIKEKCEVAGESVRCVKYDVAAQPISIHLPLSRFLAALHVHLERYNLSFTSPELLEIIENRLDPVNLIEYPLRTQVMIAQTQAGMWRRNGFSLLNQIFFYHNVRCRCEMYDRDIVMLQIGGSYMKSDDFVIHLLNKYALMNWVRPDYDIPGGQGQEDSLRQTIMLAEEFFNLLIILLEERFVPGVGRVTDKDVVKREITHQLCISPMAHSELVRALPEDANHETGVEDVVKDVANFNKPAGTGKGKYELKAEFFENYCPYFYHYTKAEQSKSEEAQRKRKKQEGKDQSLPPPNPPAFTDQFRPVINILQSEVMLHILQTILTRTAATRSRSWSEPQFERVLYLIGIALHEQVRAFKDRTTDYDFISVAMRGDHSILSLLKSLVNSNNVTNNPSKDLLGWVLKKFREVRMMKNPAETEGLEHISSSNDLKSEAEKKKKAEIAAKKRAKVMTKMAQMQKDFIKGNAVLFESTCVEMKSAGSDMDVSEPTGTDFPVALGQGRNNVATGSPIMATCILCQEEQEVAVNGKAMVLAAYVQRSTVLSYGRSKHLEADFDPLFLTSDMFSGTKTGSCGHIMHHECWQNYFDVILAKERRRPLRFRQALSYDIDKLEYLCPLCEALSNTVIPIVPSLHKLVNDSVSDVDLTFDDWLDGIKKTVENSIEKEIDQQSQEESLFIQPCPIGTITRMMAESVAKNFQLLWEYVYDDASGCFSEGMREMMKKFARDVYSFGLGVDPDDDNDRVPIMAWTTCAFTIQTIEQTLQLEKKPLFGSVPSRQLDLLNSLVKYAAVCGQVMPPDTVKQHCVRLLTAMIPEQATKLKKDCPCVIDLDMFHYLVILGMTLPTLYAEQQQSFSSIPTGGLNDKHALQLVLTAHLVQVLLTYDPQPNDGMEMETDREGEDWLRIYFNLREDAGIKSEISPSPWQLNQYIRKAVSPFLRCATILYHHLTGIPAPPDLQTNFPEGGCTEFELLCKYLSLPASLTVLIDDSGSTITTLVDSWCKSPKIKERMSANYSPIVCFPRPVNQLVHLPDDYSELINQASTFTCPKSEGDDSRAPTMCLVCGAMLCSQSYCCRTQLEGSNTPVGAATAHAHYCGAGMGIFLRVRDCQVLLLSGRIKGCFVPPPYLDDYGETDQGLRRGNPLHLCRDQYEDLHRLWFKHSVPQTIAHSIESNNSFSAIEWHNL